MSEVKLIGKSAGGEKHCYSAGSLVKVAFSKLESCVYPV